MLFQDHIHYDCYQNNTAISENTTLFFKRFLRMKIAHQDGAKGTWIAFRWGVLVWIPKAFDACQDAAEMAPSIRNPATAKRAILLVAVNLQNERSLPSAIEYWPCSNLLQNRKPLKTTLE